MAPTPSRAVPEDPRDPASLRIVGAEPRTTVQRVQVVARWNHWALVRDPEDGSERWVDLERASFART